MAVATFAGGVGMARAQNNETVLHYFDGGGDGSRPASGLIRDAAGNLYGTSWMGGATNSGVVYELSPVGNGWTERVIHSFNGPVDGAAPFDSLVMDGAGNLYGTTQNGGAYNQGTVLKLEPASDGQWICSVLHAFTGGEDGGAPMYGLILDGAGNLYGTTIVGGIPGGKVCFYGCGVAFKVAPDSDGRWIETVLYAFRGGSDGRIPIGALLLDKLGNLYGSADQGGELKNCDGLGCGVVFELSPTSQGEWKESVLYEFAGGRDGASSGGALVFDSVGNLYGVGGGGDLNSCPGGCGVIFELSPNSSGGWQETLLHTFRGPIDGQGPVGPLTFDTEGNLFGVTEEGGPYSGGVVYELSHDGNGCWMMTEIHSFRQGGFQGSGLAPGLLLDPSDNVYGVAASGGPMGDDGGVVFEIKAKP
jgi:uncharacterized repeat protein (TIGR03803 family)